MATKKRHDGPTPNGGAYSELYFMDKNFKIVDESIATHCVIRECDKNGKLIHETFGLVNPKGEKR